MGTYRAQFFESVDLEILQYEVNEFLNSLPDELTKVVGIAMGGARCEILYKLNKSEKELMEMAKQLAEEEKKKMRQEAERPVSEEELKRIVEENWNKNKNKNKEGDTAAPTPTIKPPPDSPPMAPPIAAATLEYDIPPPKIVDKSKPLQDQPVSLS